MEHRIDEKRLLELIEESEDLQVDAMRAAKEPLESIVEIGRERRASSEYKHLAAEDAAHRASMTRKVAVAGLAGAGFGAALIAASAVPAFAAANVDVQAMQTAASLENLAVVTYQTALTLPYIKNGNAVVKAFAEKTMMQHSEHGKAFNAKVKELGGKEQTKPNPKYTPVVMGMVPKLKAGGPADVVGLAMLLEDIATSTYVKDVQTVTDPQVRVLFGTIAGVESMHLATLNAVSALLKGGLVAQIKLPPDADKLPAATGMAAIPETFKKTDKASPPEEGAVA
ncbi:MAG: ferritin-like domain-containing protein [Pseudonocardiales bacterium]